MHHCVLAVCASRECNNFIASLWSVLRIFYRGRAGRNERFGQGQSCEAERTERRGLLRLASDVALCSAHVHAYNLSRYIVHT